LLNRYTAKSRIEGSNPSVTARPSGQRQAARSPLVGAALALLPPPLPTGLHVTL
jgi:hypothetical protein